MQIAIKVNEGVTILLSEEKIEELVKEKYQEVPINLELQPQQQKVSWKDGTNKSRWTKEEDQQIIKFLDGYGATMTNYQILAGRLGRTFEAVKGRVSVLRIKARFIKKGINEPNRSVEPSQLKFQKVKRKRNHKRWKASEDKKLEYFIKKYGNNKDSRKEVANILRRSPHSIQIRISNLKNKSGAEDFTKKIVTFKYNQNEKKTEDKILKFNKMRKWTETEEEVVRKEVLAGGRTTFNYKRIAKLINRSVASIQQKESKLRRRKKGFEKI